jgi:uncharacterized protein involved in exopolysaccharide biosynthesis
VRPTLANTIYFLAREPEPDEMNETAEPLFDRGLHIIMQHAKLLLLISFVGAIAAVAISYLFTPVFRAEAILVPSDETLGLGQSSQLAGLGGLAALVGVGGMGNKQTEAIAILKSRALTYDYIQANMLLPVLFHDRWDSAASNWKTSNKSEIPTLEDGYIAFDRNIRTVVENRKSGLITISVTWEDPKLAKKWADGLVTATNDLLRHQAIERSTKNIDYLQHAAEKTSITEVKATIYKLMETEIKKQMTAIGNTDYAFRVVDPAVIPEHKSAPKRSIFAVFGAVLSGMAWFVVLAFRSRVTSIRSAR